MRWVGLRIGTEKAVIPNGERWSAEDETLSKVAATVLIAGMFHW